MEYQPGYIYETIEQPGVHYDPALALDPLASDKSLHTYQDSGTRPRKLLRSNAHEPRGSEERVDPESNPRPRRNWEPSLSRTILPDSQYRTMIQEIQLIDLNAYVRSGSNHEKGMVITMLEYAVKCQQSDPPLPLEVLRQHRNGHPAAQWKRHLPIHVRQYLGRVASNLWEDIWDWVAYYMSLGGYETYWGMLEYIKHTSIGSGD